MAARSKGGKKHMAAVIGIENTGVSIEAEIKHAREEVENKLGIIPKKEAK